MGDTGFDAAYGALPSEAEWTSSFGYPGEGGFTEYYRTPDGRRFRVSNGSALSPFRRWTCEEVGA